MSVFRNVISKLRPKTRARTNREAVERVQKKTLEISEAELSRTRAAATVVSDPQDVSNLRRVLLRIRPDETEPEKQYRTAYEEVQEWNHRYWTEHNRLFLKQRSDFVERHSKGGDQLLDAEEMSVFYRTFLNENRDKHWRYNLEWYRRHFSLLPLDLRARFSRLKLQLHG